MKVRQLAFVVLLTVWLLATGEAVRTSDEARLTGFITLKLNELGWAPRPVSDSKDNVTVRTELSVIEVNSVKSDSAEIDCWLKMSWQDPRIRWDKAEYGGLSSVALPANMWLPDIRPYTVLSYQPDREGPIRVVVSEDGTILLVQPARIRFQCRVNSTKDRVMTCLVKLGSWVYNAKQVDIRLDGEGVETSYFMDSGWTLQSASAKREELTYDCCPEAYPSITVTLAIKKEV